MQLQNVVDAAFIRLWGPVRIPTHSHYTTCTKNEMTMI